MRNKPVEFLLDSLLGVLVLTERVRWSSGVTQDDRWRVLSEGVAKDSTFGPCICTVLHFRQDHTQARPAGHIRRICGAMLPYSRSA